MIEIKSILQFLETMFNTPTQQIVCDNRFYRGVELIGDKDMIFFIIFLVPFSQNYHKLQRDIATIQFGVKRVGFIGNFTYFDKLSTSPSADFKVTYLILSA